MLGRLTRWLRLIGFDTLYYPHITDSLLLRRAREEERILLTRDTRLVKVRGLRRFLLLHENDPLDQLKEIISSFELGQCINDRLGGSLPVSRCPLCNSPLHDIAKDRAKGAVPEYIFRTHSAIRHCNVCEKFYWNGTHQKRVREKLLDILQSV